jgi:hypothetical protein
LGGQLEDGLRVYSEYRSDLNGSCHSLFSALFCLSFEQQRMASYSLGLFHLAIRLRIIPKMHEQFPADFDFSSHTIFEAKNTFLRVLQAIETHVQSLKLPRMHDLLLQKTIMLDYLDQLDRMFDYQMCAVRDANTSKEQLAAWDAIGEFERHNLGAFHMDALKRAADLFGWVRARAPPSVNLRYVLRAMDLIKRSPDITVRAAIAKSRNEGVLTFVIFLRTYVTDKKMVSVLLFEWEFTILQRFIAQATQLHRAL